MPGPLAPCYLVASPTIGCSVFDRSVVLLVDDGPQGSLGFIINRRSELSFSALAKQAGLRPRPSASIDRTAVMVGGPVSSDAAWILFRPGEGDDINEDPETIHVSENLCVSASSDLMHRLAQGGGPWPRTLMLGYAGWAPGQLEDEIRKGLWVALQPVDVSLLFDTEVDTRWEDAWRRFGVDPRRLVGGRIAQA